MVEKGNRTDAQQGEVAALGRHGDPDAAVMKALLDGVERKLRWADKHFATLCSELVRAREENPYRITYEPTTDPLGYKFYVHELAPPDPDLGLIIGNCIHNLRACLDRTSPQTPRPIEGFSSAEICL